MQSKALLGLVAAFAGQFFSFYFQACDMLDWEKEQLTR
jgi:hypothetical protein